MLLPEAVYDQHIILLGKTGAGKSSAARYMVEHLLDQKKRVVVVTAKADWWGLKLAADGKHPGYPVIVFGGDHSDVPLNYSSGKTMAELLATGDRSAVLQLRDMMPGERSQFWTDFAANLFRLMRGKLFLVIDEVHNFAPKGKVLDNKTGMMLHWSNKLASEARGLGITLIGASQRPAKVHNDFLTSCETLIAMRVTTKWDRDAVSDWIKGCGDGKTGAEVLDTLARFKRGDAWAWSPEAEFGPTQMHFPLFKTYDSFKPQAPTDVTGLKGWADVDLETVKEKLAGFLKEAEANDPVKLKVRIRELEAARGKESKTVQIAPDSTVMQRAIDRAVGIARKDFERYAANFSKLVRETDKTLVLLAEAALQSHHRIAKFEQPIIMVSKPFPGGEIQKGEALASKVPTSVRSPVAREQAHPRPDSSSSESNGDLQGPHRRILTALAELRSIGQDRPPKAMVAAWARYSVNGGAFNNPLGKLRTAGLIAYAPGNLVELTDAGQAEIGMVEAPDQQEVNRRIMGVLNGPERRILAALMEGGETDKETLAARAGYAQDGGAFNNPLGSLRTAGFIERLPGGFIKPSDWIFVE